MNPIVTEWLRSQVLDSGRKKQDVAAAMGLNATQFSNVLAGRRKVDFKEIQRAASFLKIALPPEVLRQYVHEGEPGAAYAGVGTSPHTPETDTPRNGAHHETDRLRLALDVVEYAAYALGRRDVSPDALQTVARKALQFHEGLQESRRLTGKAAPGQALTVSEGHTSRPADVNK